MKLDQLKTFYVVARTGSFTKAAEEMNVDQSSVSRKVIDLESRTKVRLFNRLARGLILTREGEELLVRTRHILNEIEALKNFSLQDSAPAGTLKVSTTNALASLMVVNYVPGFLAEHPGMAISLMGHEQDLDLTARESDVAIRPFVAHGPHVCQKYLMTFKYQLYASPGYLEQFGVPQSVEDLANHRLLSFCEDTEKKHVAISHTVNWLLQAGNPLGKTHKSFFQTNTVQALLKAAQLNMGIATFAEESPCFAHSGLVKVLPDLKGPELDIYYVYPKELAHSKFITCFGDHLEKTIPQIYRAKKA